MVLALVVFYMIGIGLGIMPEYMKSMLNWGADNFTEIVLLVCFTVGCYVVLQFINRNKHRGEV
jgi:hypothetical protein